MNRERETGNNYKITSLSGVTFLKMRFFADSNMKDRISNYYFGFGKVPD